jgi:hypothetical protein
MPVHESPLCLCKLLNVATVQEVIIEILALNDNSTVQDALSQLREDTKICFTTKLDKGLP